MSFKAKNISGSMLPHWQ